MSAPGVFNPFRLLLVVDLRNWMTFTLSLLTNDEVAAVNQDPLGKQATVVSLQEKRVCFARI